MDSEPYTVVGGGPVGTLTALAFARRGRRVRVFERRGDPRTEPPPQGRSINLALAARGIAALERADLMRFIAPQMVVMRGRVLHDEQGRTSFMAYGQNEREVIYATGRVQLNRALIEAAAEDPNIELYFAQRCTDVDTRDRLLTLQDKNGAARRESFAVLFGADGYGSTVRTGMASRGLTHVTESPLEHDYKELTIPARDEDYAFDPHALHIWPRDSYMLIALPNRDGSFTATLFLPRRGPVSFEALSTGPLVRRLFDEVFPDASAAMPKLEPEFSEHPQGRLGTVFCDRWHDSGQALLLGDAAHAIVPFHGQGLNCGFEDCTVLDELASAGGSLNEVFAEFECQRRPNTDAIASMALDNYLEMRSEVRTPEFAERKVLAQGLERLFPSRFIPRYSMVMFHPEISYADAQRRGELQERVLDRLLAASQPHPRVADVERVLDEVGL